MEIRMVREASKLGKMDQAAKSKSEAEVQLIFWAKIENRMESGVKAPGRFFVISSDKKRGVQDVY